MPSFCSVLQHNRNTTYNQPKTRTRARIQMGKDGIIDNPDDLHIFDFVKFMREFSLKAAELAPRSSTAEQNYDNIVGM